MRGEKTYELRSRFALFFVGLERMNGEEDKKLSRFSTDLQKKEEDSRVSIIFVGLVV